MLALQGGDLGCQPLEDVGVAGALLAGVDEGMFLWDFQEGVHDVVELGQG